MTDQDQDQKKQDKLEKLLEREKVLKEKIAAEKKKAAEAERKKFSGDIQRLGKLALDAGLAKFSDAELKPHLKEIAAKINKQE